MNTEDAEYCIGEKFTSIKQLISIASPYAKLASVQQEFKPNTSVPIFDFWNVRNFMAGQYHDGQTNLDPLGKWAPTAFRLGTVGDSIYACATPLCTYYALPFAFARGSTCVVARGGKTAFEFNDFQIDEWYGNASFETQLASPGPADTPWFAVRVPFYSCYPYMPSGTDRPRPLNSYFKARAIGKEGNDINLSIYAADDAQLGKFIAAWPLAIPQSMKAMNKNYEYLLNSTGQATAYDQTWEDVPGISLPGDDFVPEVTPPEQPLEPQL